MSVDLSPAPFEDLLSATKLILTKSILATGGQMFTRQNQDLWDMVMEQSIAVSHLSSLTF